MEFNLKASKKPKKKKIRSCSTEDVEHILCANWLRGHNIPFHCSPNGGKRDPWVGKKLKEMGLRPGWPDFEIIIPKKGFHALFIELKALDGIVSLKQKIIIDELNQLGYLAKVAYGFAEFKSIVKYYFS